MGNSILNRIYSDEKIVPPNMRWKTIEIEEYRRIHENSIKDPVRFWEHEALKLKWEKMWTKAIDGHPPKNIWFKDGMINTYHNIIGKHKETWIWFKPAIIWESEDEDVKVITYEELNSVVERLSGALKNLGINSDEWIIFYTPPMIESIALMLASIRMGIPFEPIFTGFSYGEVVKRVSSRKPKIIVTTDGFMRRSKIVNTLDNIRKALNSIGHKCNVIVIERIESKGLLENEISYEKFMESSNTKIRDYIASSQHKLFGLHTAYEEDFKPITHSVGGYLTQVYATSRWIGLRPHDTYFCTVWPGWITGVSYVIFGPLMIGSTIVLYEGSIDYPSWDRLWSIIERYAVTIFLTTGGALRLLSKNDASYMRSHNMDTLRAILVTADPLYVDTWMWTYKIVGTGYTPTINSIPEKLTGRIPVINMYIQSELGTFITGSLINYTFTPLIPGSIGLPIPGFHLDVINDNGKSVRGCIGELIIRNPWPSTPIESPKEFQENWIHGYYRTGDYALMNKDGYIFALGRRDTVMKVSGYRLSPGAMEETLQRMLNLKKVIVVGEPDEIRFEAPTIMIEDYVKVDEVRRIVREYIGPIADPKNIISKSKLPDIPKEELRKIIKNEFWR